MGINFGYTIRINYAWSYFLFFFICMIYILLIMGSEDLLITYSCLLGLVNKPIALQALKYSIVGITKSLFF